jgi:transcriptional regulator with XRE-family HTH domain
MTKFIVGRIVGQIFKDIRGEMTQAEFAKILRIPQGQYNRYETGKRIPSDEVLDRIMRLAPDLESRIFTLHLNYLTKLAFPDMPPRTLAESLSDTKAVEGYCVLMLIVLACKKTGIKLTEKGFHRILEIAKDNTWPDILNMVSNLVHRTVEISPSWQAKSIEETDSQSIDEKSKSY